VALQITNPADTRFAKALFFSPPGHGKTHLLGTAQEDERTSPMLLLDFEGGEETLAGLDIDMAKIRSWDDYSEAYELLTSDSKDNKYRSVGIDSASETHIWALLEIVKRKGPTRKEPDLIEQGDYGVAGTQMRRLLREFRDLPMHVFYTATTKEVDERGLGKVKVPALSGQMADEIVALMSIVGYLAIQPSESEDEAIDRILLLQNYPGFRTKVRTAWKTIAPDEIENPTIGSLMDALQIDTRPSREDRVGRQADIPTEEELPPDENEDEGESSNGAVSIDELTVAELKEELDERGVEFNRSASKGDLRVALRDTIAADDGQADPSGGDN
jgi:hypothetical protein